MNLQMCLYDWINNDLIDWDSLSVNPKAIDLLKDNLDLVYLIKQKNNVKIYI